MQKELFIPIILAIVAIPIGLLGGTMPAQRSRVPPLISGISSVLILGMLALYYANLWVTESFVFISSIVITGLLVVSICVFLVLRRKKANVVVDAEKIIQSNPHVRRTEAQAIHNRIIELINGLWETKDKLPTTEDLQQNTEITSIMDELQSELNGLGHLINDHRFDRFAEDLMLEYSRFLEFHYDVHHDWGEWGRARINSKFRAYINKVKG